MANTWTDTAGNVLDQIGIVVADGPIHNGKDALGIIEGDTAFFDAGGETQEGNDGKNYDALPVFYPGTDTYEDAAGNIHAVAMIGSAPDGPDFTGWSAGSEAGVYTDGETGGKFPTGVDVLNDGADITIDEATHQADGVECITSTFDIAESAEVIIYFPDFQTSSPGQTWKALVYVADIENTDIGQLIFGVAEFDAGQSGIDFNAIELVAGLNEFERAISPEAAFVRGQITIASAVPSSLTITMALKLEQIS